MARAKSGKFLSSPIMRDLIKILIWLFFVSLAIFLQSNQFLSFRGVNPNLILLLVFLPLILEKEFLRALLLIFTALVLTVVFLPYWPKEILILGGLALAGLFLRKFLTGNELGDFLILIFSGTLGFYLIKAPSYLIADFISVVVELIYNIILGIFLVFFNNQFPKN